jgi:hypothetical protein
VAPGGGARPAASRPSAPSSWAAAGRDSNPWDDSAAVVGLGRRLPSPPAALGAEATRSSQAQPWHGRRREPGLDETQLLSERSVEAFLRVRLAGSSLAHHRDRWLIAAPTLSASC